MKILWLCNIVLPELCEEFGFKKGNTGGWLPSMWKELKSCDDFELGICVPIFKPQNMKDGIYENYRYFSFPFVSESELLPVQRKRFEEILTIFQPDLIHIWGTEYFHSFAMTQACRKGNFLDHVIVNIQGLVSVCSKHFTTGVPKEILEFKKNDRQQTILELQEDFEMRGRYEIQLLKEVKHAVGRTDWDKACVLHMNPNINYYECGEILREEFYEKAGSWSLPNCRKHSIFISQAAYSVKGFHLVLEQMAELAERYADLRIYVAGVDLGKEDSAYASYVMELIHTYHLQNHIIFTGILEAKEMAEHYLKSNVFLSPSTIENSSNSVCEALCLGVPVVASYVGGLPSLIEHGKSGLLYPLEESYMISYYIQEIFENEKKAKSLSECGKKQVRLLNNREEINKKVLEIYAKVNS